MSQSIYKWILQIKADTNRPVSEIKRLQSNTDKADKSMRDFNKTNQNGISILKNFAAAAGAAFSVGAVINFGKQAMAAYDIQARAEAKVAQAITQTGKAAGFSANELKKVASGLQNISRFGDEVILNDVTAQLLTFTNITGDNFLRTQKVALDLATVLDGDLKSASIQLGKALNDPTTALSALSRSGIQFSKAQKEQIDSLINANQLFEAQALILDELERQYGGQAEAALAGTGALTQLANAYGDLREEVGKLIVESDNFTKSVDGLKRQVKIIPDDVNRFVKVWKLIWGNEASASYKKNIQGIDESIRDFLNTTEKASGSTKENTNIFQKNNSAVVKQVTTYGDLIKQIGEKTELLKQADITDTVYISTIYAQIAALEEKKKAFEALAIVQQPRDTTQYNTVETRQEFSIDVPKVEVPGLADMGGFIDQNAEKVRQLREEIARLQEQAASDAWESLNNSFFMLGQNIDGAAGSFFQFASQMTEMIPLLISQITALAVTEQTQSAATTTAKQGEAMASGIAQSQKVGFPLNLIALAATVASIVAAFTKIPKFELGGVVPGHSFAGDRMLVRVNSGEEILRRDDPRHTFNQTGTMQPAVVRERIIIPTTRIRKGDIYISYNEAATEQKKRTGKY